MSEQAEHTVGPRQHANEAARPATTTVPWVIRRYGTRFGWRHVKGIALIRLVVAVWLVLLASVLCADGRWWGAVLFGVAGLIGWLAYQMPRWQLALDAERSARPTE